jgi:hypothetical protein
VAISIINSKQTPWALLIALAMIVCVEILIAQYGSFLSHSDSIIVAEKIRFTERPYKDYQILILGDSSIQFSVKAYQLQQLTGLSAYNLAGFGSHTLLMQYCWFSNYLENVTAKPKVVVFGILPWTLALPEIIDFRRYSYDRRCTAEFTKWHGYLQTALSIIPSLQHRFFARTLIHDRDPAWGPTAEEQATMRQTLKEQQGYYNYKPQHRWNPTTEAKWSQDIPRFQISPLNQEYFLRILDLAQQSKSKTFVVVGIAPGRTVPEYNKFLEKLPALYPGLQLIDPSEILNSPALYYDYMHLNAEGAELLTRFVAEQVNSELQ